MTGDKLTARGQLGDHSHLQTIDEAWTRWGSGEATGQGAESGALDASALAVHLVPELSATSQDECWPAAPVGRDRRHSERSNPGQDPAQPSQPSAPGSRWG